MKILVTGANGFVGKELVANLSNNFNFDVNTLSRNHNNFFSKNISQHVFPDFNLINDFSKILKNCDIIIHLAAISNNLRDTPSNIIITEDININFTRDLLKFAIIHKVKKFIFLSSIKVYGEFTKSDYKSTENDILQPVNKYSKSKYLAEKNIVETCQNADIDYLILRSPLIYGQSNNDNFGILLKAIKYKFPLPLKNIKSIRSVTHINNLIDLIIIYIFEEKKIRNIINICDDFDMDILKLLKIINKNKKRIYLFSFPFTTLLPLFRLFKFDTKISKLLYSQRVSNEKAKKILNWSPKINIYDFIEKIFNK